MLVLFSVSGIWQIFGWQWNDGKIAGWMKTISMVHMGHQMSLKAQHYYTPDSAWLEYFAVLMALSLILSIILGVILAFRYGRGTLALASLAGGVLVPAVLILIFGHVT